MIRLQTSEGANIPNHQGSEVTGWDLHSRDLWEAKIRDVRRRTEELSAKYNCHGLVFASRRTRITEPGAIGLIIADDQWESVDRKDVLPGDIVIYWDQTSNDPTHSAVVVEAGALDESVRVVSKWGNGLEYLHGLYDVPDIYGTTLIFYRCRKK